MGSANTASSLIERLTLPNGAWITNTYDVNARMLGTWLYNSSASALDSSVYTNNVGNQRISVTRNSENTASYTYDAIGQVIGDQSSEVTGGTSRMNEQLHYAFDPAGNLNYRTNNTLVEKFQVNTLNELTSNTNGGKLTVMGTATSQNSTTVSVNSSNALVYGDATFAATNMPITNSYTAIAADSYGRHSTNTVTVSIATNVTYQYDGNGNLTNDGLRSFAYDDENQLIQVWVTNQWFSQFGYDGKLRRRIRQEFTWQTGQWVQTNEIYYVYDGNVVIQERSASNIPSTTYTRGNDLNSSLQGAGGIGGLLAMTLNTELGPSSSNSMFYHSDGNGNVTMLINSSQSIVAAYLYDAFGNVLSAAGSFAQANLYRFSSKEAHLNSGLTYYLYRYCDPSLQRWLNRDPLGELGGVSLYSYAVNNPLNAIDLWGLMSKCDCDKLRGQIFRKARGLLDDLRRYDPVQDGLGGHPMGGGRFTKPGGHFQEILERQGGLKDDLALYLKECVKNDNDPSDPIPRQVDDMANRRVPLPVYPSPNLIIYVPGSPNFWDGVATGALYTGAGAGIIATGGVLAGVLGGGAIVGAAAAAF